MIPDELPELPVAAVEDEETLAEIVDAAVLWFTKNNPGLVEVDGEIRLAEEILQLVEPDAWKAYLAIDELRNARGADLAVLLVRWAFVAGAGAARRPGGSP